MSSTRKIDKHGRDYWTGQAIIRYPKAPNSLAVGLLLEAGIDVEQVPGDNAFWKDGYITIDSNGRPTLNPWPSEELHQAIFDALAGHKG